MPLPGVSNRISDDISVDDQCCHCDDDHDDHRAPAVNISTTDVTTPPPITAEDLDDWFGMEKVQPVAVEQQKLTVKKKKSKTTIKHSTDSEEDTTSVPNPLVATLPSESSEEENVSSVSSPARQVKTAAVSRSSPMPEISTEGKKKQKNS